MKKLLALLAFAPLLLISTSCEQQKWEETKMFKQTLPEHKSGDAHGAHGAAATAPAGHAEAPKH